MHRLFYPFLLAVGAMCAQPQSPEIKVHHLEETPVFRVDVVEKVTLAINYRHRSGATKIDFQGTQLMPQAKGEAKVESKRGYIEIEVEFRKMQSAMTFGAEYLTFVMWAVTPEGRAANLGEILVNNGRSKLNVTTELQVFSLIVTAEPYFAVRQPSDLVVMENEVRKETKGKIEVINAKYELLKRGQYKPLANPLALTVDPRIPLELYEARNAVQIARASGADRYAGDIFLKAERSLGQAEAYQARKAGKKPVAMLAREAVQTSEDARELAVRREEQERLARERKEADDREAQAKAAAEREARLRAETEARRKAEAEQRAEAERREQEKAQRNAVELAKLESELSAARKAAHKATEDAKQIAAILEQTTATINDERTRWEEERKRRETEDAERKRRLAELGKAELRIRLYNQLNELLPVRDSNFGLVIEVTDEIFETGSSDLTTTAREKLSVLTGFLLAHPGLAFSFRESSQPLTQERIQVIRAYLIERSLPEAAPREDMLFEMNPTAPAAETDGILENYSLELIIAGEPIGIALRNEDTEVTLPQYNESLIQQLGNSTR